MATTDTCGKINPYFRISSGETAKFRELADRCVAQTRSERKCLYYGFSYDGDMAFRREGYTDAQGLLDHLGNVGPILQELFRIADLKPQFFTLESAFRR